MLALKENAIFIDREERVHQAGQSALSKAQRQEKAEPSGGKLKVGRDTEEDEIIIQPLWDKGSERREEEKRRSQ